MKRLVIGILAHVDAGKTTLSEAMLYRAGSIRRLGRVDHRDAFLDTDAAERARGITIFSKQAMLKLPDAELTLLDTPGHVDFSGEMERTLQVLDYAVLVVSGTDGVQSHTRTVWRLLARWRVPVFIFVNKMDLPGPGRDAILRQLRGELDENCIDCAGAPDAAAFCEEAVLRDEALMARYLETGALPDAEVARLVRARRLFLCCFGAALRLDGVDALLDALRRYTAALAPTAEFGAQVYKVARDAQGVRLTYLKVTGGTLRARAVLRGVTALGEPWEEKADQLRLYSGARFVPAEQAGPGTVCAVTGLSHTWPGEGLGAQADAPRPVLAPVQTCRVLPPEGADPHETFLCLRQLEEEEPLLAVRWDGTLREIHLRLMGEVQLEILRGLIETRFGLAVTFTPGNIVYQETIAAPVEGVGHFEPLRHYAEVHLLLEPGAPGSGLQFAAACREELLDKNWQRLVLTHLAEKEHRGVLTGAPLTDVKITLVAGRAHLKHTEGGDFRQATYRAVRQGLMQAQSVLLEPWYDFRLELPAESVGRAIADIQRMGGSFAPPEPRGDGALLTGRAPAAGLRDYQAQVTAYTRGRGRFSCALRGYEPCHDAEQVIAASGYDPARDTDNPADSVFCAHGAGYHVPWNEVKRHMHVNSGLRLDDANEPRGAREPEQPAPERGMRAGLALDKELEAIFCRTYGPIAPRAMRPAPRPAHEPPAASARRAAPAPEGPEYLLVDGYNVIFAWDDLKALAEENIEAARRALADALCNYSGFRACRVILVFDAYKVRGGLGAVERYHSIDIVYTREAETADMYIEKVTYEIGKRHRVRVVTSDGAEQLIILGHGALRVSAAMFRRELEEVNRQIAELLDG